LKATNVILQVSAYRDSETHRIHT